MSDIEKVRHVTKEVAIVSVDDGVESKSALCHAAGCLGSRTSTLTLTNPPVRQGSHTAVTDSFPDGGAKAWLTVFGAFVALFCTFGQMNAFGTFQAWYTTHQLHNLSPSAISWIGSLQLWAFFFFGGPIGQFYDRYGPRVLMMIGMTLYIFSIMMTSISTQFYQYVLCQGLGFGLGVGLLFYPSLASVSTQFSKYRATALGIAASGSSFGGVVYPVMLQQLFESVGFEWGVRISGLISAICCAAAVLLVNSRLSADRRCGPVVDFDTFRDIRFMLLALGSWLVALGLFIPFFYIVDYAHDLHLPSQISFYILAVLNAGGVVGRIVPACISDNLGRFNLLVPSAFFSGLLCLVFWFLSRDLVSIMLFAALYGFFSGSFISLITPCVAQISEITEIGTRIGTLYTIISFPSLLGSPIAGVLLAKAHGSYAPMIALSGSVIVAGSLFILWSKFRIDKHIFACV